MHKLETPLQYRWLAGSDHGPVMIVLHGRGDRLNSFLSLPHELRIPGMNYLLVNAPRAYDGGFSWYAFEPKQARGILKARVLLQNLIAELQELGWRSEQIFLYGFSQGALVSADLALRTSVPLGGVIAISGYIYFFEDWQRSLTAAAFSTPWLVTHGFDDDALPIYETREHILKLQSVGLPIMWREFLKGHDIDLGPETSLIRKWVMARTKVKPKARITTDSSARSSIYLR